MQSFTILSFTIALILLAVIVQFNEAVPLQNNKFQLHHLVRRDNRHPGCGFGLSMCCSFTNGYAVGNCEIALSAGTDCGDKHPFCCLAPGGTFGIGCSFV
ncbi:hypothetical protein I4U23_016726 [Adineta vaga]|nr:hypothetical protein I4U23_016726 [Adineta vaga]